MAIDLVCFGEAFDDLVFYGLPHLPRPGEEIKTERFLRTVGGGAIITACAARRLGSSVRVLSALGPEAAKRLDAEGIPYRNLREEGESPALTVALSTASDRSFVTFEAETHRLEERLLGVLGRETARHFHGALCPRKLSRWTALLGELRRSGATTSWDFGYNPALVEDPTSRSDFLDLLGGLDILFVNELEAQLYSGRSDLQDALFFFRDRIPITVLKRGAMGCRWANPDLVGSVAAFPVDACDTTGAGDAFDAGFLHAVLAGRPLDTCAELANRVGALSTRKPGGIDGLPYARELA